MLHRTNFGRVFTSLLGGLCALVGLSAAADVPGRVGRITLVQGNVSIFHDRDDGWQPAQVNFPVTRQNSLFTDIDARAEVRVGGAAIRLDELSQVDIQELDYDLFHIHVVKGTVALTVRYFDRADRYIVTTPEGRFAIRNNGRYRFDVDAKRAESALTVFRGSARFEDEGRRATQVEPGRKFVVVATNDSRAPDFYFDGLTYASFDDWSQGRDDRWTAPRNTRHVSTYVTGYEDFDEHGYWSNEPTYGAVWYPRTVSYGWAPFRHGRWQWIRPWGWTWVDAAPWGFAVSHYGRWAYINGRWGWCPGNYVARPVWAPAVVGFYGHGNWAAGIRGPLVGWYPLSPWENYNPWYTNNATYIRNVNNVTIVNNNTTIINNYNRQNGTTTVLREAFGSGAPVQNNLQRLQGEPVWQQVPTVSNNFQSALPSRVPRSKPLEAPVVATSAPGSYATPQGAQPSTRIIENTSGARVTEGGNRVLGEQGSRTAPTASTTSAPGAPVTSVPPSTIFTPQPATQPLPQAAPAVLPRAKPLEVPSRQASAAPTRVGGEAVRPADPNYERAYRATKESGQVITAPRDTGRRNSGAVIGENGERTAVQAKRVDKVERVERRERAEGDRVQGQRVEALKPRHEPKPDAPAHTRARSKEQRENSPRLSEHQR